MRNKFSNLVTKKGGHNNEAFTLIELVMVILLIGILAAVVLPKFVNLTGQANKAASQGVVGSIGEGLTTQLSKNLVNNDLSTFIVITGVSSTSGGTVTLNPVLPAANAAGTNPYANPFLLLPNYSMPATGYGSGVSYNFGNPIATGLTTVPSDSWWVNYSVGTATGPGTASTSTSAGLTCDNNSTTNANYAAPTVTVSYNEYVLQLGNVDYVYSNGSTVDSYAYYMSYSVNGNVDGVYLAPCQS